MRMWWRRRVLPPRPNEFLPRSSAFELGHDRLLLEHSNTNPGPPLTVKPKKPRKPAAKKTRAQDHEYRVVWNGRRKTWDIKHGAGYTGAFSRDKSTAIGLAVHDAQREAHQGLDVVVCVQQKDGSFELEWSSA